MRNLFCLLLIIVKITTAAEIKNNTHHYSFNLPEGWDTIPYLQIKSAEERALKTATDKSGLEHYETGIYYKQNVNYFNYPYVLMRFSPRQNINSLSLKKIFKQLSKSPSNQDLTEMVGSFTGMSNLKITPNTFYIDTVKSVAFTSIQVDYKNVGTVNTLIAMYVASDGILFVNSYSLNSKFDRPIKEFLDSITFEKQHKYIFKSGFEFNWARMVALAIILIIISFVRKLRGDDKKSPKLMK